MKQIRQSIFETNSSSTHTFSHYYKVETNSIEDEIKRNLNRDGQITLDLNWFINEDGDLSLKNKLNIIFASIPGLYSRDKNGDLECEMDFNYDKFMENETVKFICNEFKSRFNVEFDFSSVYHWIRRARDNQYEKDIFDEFEFWLDEELIMDFLTNPAWRMSITEYMDS